MLPDDIANEAVNAVTVEDLGTLAVVALSEYDKVFKEAASEPRNGK